MSSILQIQTTAELVNVQQVISDYLTGLGTVPAHELPDHSSEIAEEARLECASSGDASPAAVCRTALFIASERCHLVDSGSENWFRKQGGKSAVPAESPAVLPPPRVLLPVWRMRGRGLNNPAAAGGKQSN